MIQYDKQNERLIITSDEGDVAIINNVPYVLTDGVLEIGNPRAIASEIVVTIAKSLEEQTITFSE